MRCTCCLFMLTLWSAAAGCNNRMPMCIGSFSLHSKWIGLSKRYPNSSVLRCDVESDRLIGNYLIILNSQNKNIKQSSDVKFTLHVVWTKICVGSVCTHPSYNDTNLPSVFFYIYFLNPLSQNQAVLRFLQEWRSSAQAPPTIVDLQDRLTLDLPWVSWELSSIVSTPVQGKTRCLRLRD